MGTILIDPGFINLVYFVSGIIIGIILKAILERSYEETKEEILHQNPQRRSPPPFPPSLRDHPHPNGPRQNQVFPQNKAPKKVQK